MNAFLNSIDSLNAQRIDRKRLARLSFRRKPSMDYSSDNALYIARHYVCIGLANYQVAGAKQESRVALHHNNLSRAIFYTQIALFIGRIQRAAA